MYLNSCEQIFLLARGFIGVRRVPSCVENHADDRSTQRDSSDPTITL